MQRYEDATPRRPKLAGFYSVLEHSYFMKVGDRVRVKESVVVYHYPEYRNQPYDLQDMTGEIIGFATEWQGKTISANFPVVVKFDNSKFRAHLKDHEIELA